MADGDGVAAPEKAPPAAPAKTPPAAQETTGNDRVELGAVVPPATMTIIGALKQQRGGVLYWEGCDVLRNPVIAESKYSAVRAVLDGAGKGRLYISNGFPLITTWPPPAGWTTAPRFRISFAPDLTEAQVTTFLTNVDTAAT